MRQAIAYAINREQFVNSQLPEGAEVATIFYPDTVDGWTDDVEQYAYDPQKAKDLLAEAGQSNLTLNFWWPTEVTRPYMPDPKAVFTAFKADLEAVGITVNEIVQAVERWLPGRRRGRSSRTSSCSAGPVTTTPRTTSSAPSSPGPPNRFGTDSSPWGTTLSDSLKAADASRMPAKRTADVRGAEQAADGRIPAGGADLALAAGDRGRPVTSRA